MRHDGGWGGFHSCTLNERGDEMADTKWCFDFTDKRILVTGGSRGIGWATAKAFLDVGARVAVNGRTGESTSAGIERLGGGEQLIAAPGDIATVAGCEAAVGIAVDALGGLDVLVNSAGVAWRRLIDEGDEAFWDATIDVNLKGTYFCCRAAIRRSARAVATSSTSPR